MHSRARLFIYWPLVLAVVAVVGMRPVLEWLYPLGARGDPAFDRVVSILMVLVLLWASAMLLLRKRPLAGKLNLAGCALFIVFPLLGELALRASFLIESSPLRHPRHFANHMSDDDYWKLHLRWIGTWKVTPNSIHPVLGWTQVSVSKMNPFGFKRETFARFNRDGRKKIIFYGDSFVAGVAEPEFELPNYMDRQFASADVIDAGVGGYGIGQTYLMFRETRRLLDKPFVIIGIMTADLDRSILTVRTGRKPRLRVMNDALVVTGTPISKDQKAFYASAPLDLRSFLLALLVSKIRRLSPAIPDHRIDEKKRLSARIIEEIAKTCKEEGLDLHFVIFYSQGYVGGVGWQEAFLLPELLGRGLSYLDTKPLLLEYCKQRGESVGILYNKDGGHHNALGNRVIGDALTTYLKKRGYE